MAAPTWLRQAIEDHGQEACDEKWGLGPWQRLLDTNHRAQEALYVIRGADHNFAAALEAVTADKYTSLRQRQREARSEPSAPRHKAAPSADTVETRATDDGLSLTAKGFRVRTLSDLLEAAEVDLDAWTVKSWRANTWEVATRDRGVIPVWQVRADLERIYRPLRPAQPLRDVQRTPPKTRRDGLRRALFVPDSQHGFRWHDGHRRLEPLHDRVACDVIVQLAKLMQPDVIVLLGDMADLAPWSTKFPREPSLKQTTQPTLDELYWWLGEMRDACPSARMVYTAGNHEERISKASVTQMEEAVGVRAVGDTRPALDWARLLNLDSLGVEYVGPYGQDFWLWEQVRVHHGTGSGSRSAMASRVERSSHSEVHGHVHKVGTMARTVWGPSGPRLAQYMSPGCLCRLDGAVPGVSSRPDWQHGAGIGFYDETTDSVHLVGMPIVDGRLVWQGAVIEGQDRRSEIAGVTGWLQMV